MTQEESVIGCAAYYNKGVMEAVAVNRGYIKSENEYSSWLASNGYVGAVALYRKQDINRKVWILWPDGIVDGPYFAIDVVSEGHFQLGIKRERVIDIDYNTKIKKGLKGPMKVVIMLRPNGRLLPLEPMETGITFDKYNWCLNLTRIEK